MTNCGLTLKVAVVVVAAIAAVAVVVAVAVDAAAAVAGFVVADVLLKLILLDSFVTAL